MIDNIGKNLRSGNSKETRKSVIEALNQGYSYNEILEYMLDIMADVGKKFKVNELFVPEVLIIGRSFNVALEVISPMLVHEENERGTVVIGTVKGDLHDIGKNLVKMLLGATGAKVIDLGVDVPAMKFVEAIREHNPDILAMSALITTTMVQMNQTIKLLIKEHVRDQVKIMIGGAPITENYAKNIGADYFAIDAASGAEIVRAYIKEKNNQKDGKNTKGQEITKSNK